MAWVSAAVHIWLSELDHEFLRSPEGLTSLPTLFSTCKSLSTEEQATHYLPNCYQILAKQIPVSLAALRRNRHEGE